jgi:rubredoxin
MITLAQFSKPEEAHLLRLRLEAGGVPAFVQDENLVQLNWLYSNAIGGVRVQVFEADLDAAKEILAEHPLDETPTRIPCPHCGSSETMLDEFPRKIAFLSLILLGFPILFFGRRWSCSECGHSWKAEPELNRGPVSTSL